MSDTFEIGLEPTDDGDGHCPSVGALVQVLQMMDQTAEIDVVISEGCASGDIKEVQISAGKVRLVLD